MKFEGIISGCKVYASAHHYGWSQIYPLPHMRLDFYRGEGDRRRFGIGFGWITLWAFCSITWPK